MDGSGAATSHDQGDAVAGGKEEKQGRRKKDLTTETNEEERAGRKGHDLFSLFY